MHHSYLADQLMMIIIIIIIKHNPQAKNIVVVLAYFSHTEVSSNLFKMILPLCNVCQVVPDSYDYVDTYGTNHLALYIGIQVMNQPIYCQSPVFCFIVGFTFMSTFPSCFIHSTI